MTQAEKRKDAYEHNAMIAFGEDLITYDEAAKMFNSYNAVGDTDTAGYLREQLIAAKAAIREMFPEEDGDD